MHLAPPVLVVADGVGGSAKGEVASRLAIDAFVAASVRIVAARSSEDAMREMEYAVLAANTAVHDGQLRDESRRGMATTITGAVVRDGGEVVVGHVGDSRLYVVSGAGTRQATQDHSVVAELVRTGRLEARDVATHPQRNVITRALGPEADVSVDTFVIHVGPGDWLLACSDGLTEHVADDELASLLLGNDPTTAVAALVDLANERGGTDNITVVVAQPVPSDVSGELSIEALHAAAAVTSSIPLAGVLNEAPANDSGPMATIAHEPLRAVETSGELPALQPMPNADDWSEPTNSRRRLVLLAVAVVVAALIGGFVWSQSYFLVEREDGRVGINRGFPISRLATPYRSSELAADELSDADRERLVASHRILSRDDAERVLDELERDELPEQLTTLDGGV
jgi:protein phosphatase